MKITDVLKEKGVCVGVTLQDKMGVIDLLAALQKKCGNVESVKRLRQEIFSREEEAPFGIGGGVAICSLRSRGAAATQITAVTVPKGADFDAPDGAPSRLIFLVVLPPEGEDPSNMLRALLLNDTLREQLIGAVDERIFYRLLSMVETGDCAAPAAPAQELPLILAVAPRETAAGLQLAAGRLGMVLRIAANGMLFSEEELEEAMGVLVIDGEERPCFNGLPLLKASRSDAIYRPEHLLRTVVSADVCRCKPMEEKSLLSGFSLPTPLLPVLILLGGFGILLGEWLGRWTAAAVLASFIKAAGESALMAALPFTLGLIAYRYAGWGGLAVGVIGGVLAAGLWCGTAAVLIGVAINAVWLISMPGKVHMR